MGVPTVPLSDLYSAAGAYISDRGGKVLLRTPVVAVRPTDSRVTLKFEGRQQDFHFAIMALPHLAASKVLPEDAAADELRAQMGHLETSPITGIHLWFDRQITDLDHAVLLDRTIQWMFHKSRFQPQRAEQAGSYVELVVSSSKALVERSRQEILALALRELNEFFPEVARSNLVKATVVKELHATFSVLPGADRFRPDTETAWARLFLAGDWTQTGWPATMEGAVRSGYVAAEAVMRAAESTRRFIAPDLTAAGLLRPR
jgi:uncharacterized protein with NAD-binding domain and iron-sulfur cluster